MERREERRNSSFVSCTCLSGFFPADIRKDPSVATGLYTINAARYVLPSYLLVHSPL